MDRNQVLPRVLLVDDEENILRALRRLLRRAYDVTATPRAEHALELLEEEEFAVLLSDQRMPALLGTDLAARAVELAPDTVRIILTGHADITTAVEAINKGAVHRFLTKPWQDEELLSALRHASERYDLLRENRRLQQLTREQNEQLQELNAQLRDFNDNLKDKVFERTRQVTGLNQRLTHNFRGALQAISRLAEMHSVVLGAHAKRVSALAKKVGALMGMTDDELFQLEVGALLHDVGKVGVDPEVLSNPEAKPRARDKAAMATHAVTGATLMKLMPDLKEAARSVRYHHERFDGGGLPEGLKGQVIPLGARIIAAVDAYDNWLHGRSSYTKTTALQALQYVIDRSGSEFDPGVVDTLERVITGGRIPMRREVETALSDLEPGLVLSRDLVSVRGYLLLPRDTTITQEDLARIHEHHQDDPVVEPVQIYRTRAAAMSA